MALLSALPMMAAHSDDIRIKNLSVSQQGDVCVVSMDLDLAELELRRNEQVLVTPIISCPSAEQEVQLPTVVFSGRNMHYVYLRGGQTLASGKSRYNILEEQRRDNGHQQLYSYLQSVPLQKWMMAKDAAVRLVVDNCGCGVVGASEAGEPLALNLNPAANMVVVPFPTPDPSKRKPTHHNGRARVQFEVNRTELHTSPYICKSGQYIDNRKQLQIIDDSIAYALRDPNVEIESISICGYASPESPYDHNDYLATNRSRALSEYIAHKYSLPMERCHYSAVPENWAEFREYTVNARDITEGQRAELLMLIDRPCYGPADYDAKETTLKTDPRFAQLYKTKILPDWFPKFRCTMFDITTQLKPLTPVQLREVMEKTPGLMSLDEIYLVACSYDHGTPEFLHAMEVALKEYPDDPVANLNAASIAVEREDYTAAAQYLKKAGECDEANVLRGIIATNDGDYKAARAYFEKAGRCPEAQRNLNLLK